MNDRLKEMLEMQKALDESIISQHNATVNPEMIRIAMLDEIGELTHELKGDWCWWKKTQAPVNEEKVLEELVDVWHFALSLHNHATELFFDDDCCIPRINNYIRDVDYTNIVSDLMRSHLSTLWLMMSLTYKLGFEFDDIYSAYKKKNAVNYERLKNNY